MHDLRRPHASLLLKKGVNLKVVSQAKSQRRKHDVEYLHPRIAREAEGSSEYNWRDYWV
jgi:hypothetical protein